MKKKGILFSLIGIILISSLLFVMVIKNEKKYIEKDGIYFALTLNGSTITDFPKRGNYTVDIDCQNAKGKWLVDEWKFVLEEINGRVSCDIDFNTKTDDDLLVNIISAEKTKTDINGGICSNETYITKADCEGAGAYWWGVFEENGLRYEGLHPDNYVWFNNELWRIIGYLPTKDAGSNDTNLVKIVRSESIGANVMHTAGNSTFASSAIYNLLNNYYYNKIDGTGSGYCYKYVNTLLGECDYRSIGLSGFAKSLMLPVQYAIKVYTGGTAVNHYNTEIGTWTAVEGGINVGLMSASDFGYGVLAADCVRTTKTTAYNTKICAGKNWIYSNDYEWLMTAYSTTYYWRIHDTGKLNGEGASTHGLTIRPVVYLNPSVYVLDGDGSQTNPYVLNNGYSSTFYVGSNQDQQYVNNRVTNVNFNIDNPSAAQYCVSEDGNGTNCSWSTITSTSMNVSFTLSSGDGEKNVFLFLRDSNGMLAEKIYDSIILDTTAPVINAINQTSMKTNKITVELDVTEINELDKYYFSIDNGSFVESDSNTYTFENLSASTSYTIKVYAKDKAGNSSEQNTISVTTPDKDYCDGYYVSAPSGCPNKDTTLTQTQYRYSWQEGGTTTTFKDAGCSPVSGVGCPCCTGSSIPNCGVHNNKCGAYVTTSTTTTKYSDWLTECPSGKTCTTRTAYKWYA